MLPLPGFEKSNYLLARQLFHRVGPLPDIRAGELALGGGRNRKSEERTVEGPGWEDGRVGGNDGGLAGGWDEGGLHLPQVVPVMAARAPGGGHPGGPTRRREVGGMGGVGRVGGVTAHKSGHDHSGVCRGQSGGAGEVKPRARHTVLAPGYRHFTMGSPITGGSGHWGCTHDPGSPGPRPASPASVGWC